MKSLLLVILLSSTALAGAKHSFSDPKLNDEIDNIYYEIGRTLKGDVRISSATISSVRLVGTTTNDNAATGQVGEYLSSTVGSANFPTTGQWGDATSISLTAGDWDVSCVGTQIYQAGTITDQYIGVGTVSGNTQPLDGNYVQAYPATSTLNAGASVPAVRLSLSATTTVYLKFLSNYSSTAPKLAGRISARRVR